MNKRIKKQFWLSPKDAEELKRKAELAGLTETAVVRLLIRGYEPREKPDGRFYDAMDFLRTSRKGQQAQSRSRACKAAGVI